MSDDKDGLIDGEKSSELCLVCGSSLANKNYGAFTCSPCKVFFRRNLNLDLNQNQCKLNATCEININNRIICRVCRLRKCFLIGMSGDLFRPSHTQISTNKPENENATTTMIIQSTVYSSELTFDDQLILFNIIDSYDLCSPASNITQMMKTSSNNPSKLRLKIDKNNLMIIQTYFYSSIISFIKINDKFSSLTKNDRRILIKRNINNLSGLNQLFLYDQIQFLNDPIEKSLLSNEYGQLYLDHLLIIIEKMPFDRKIIKFFLIILTFSTCTDTVHFDLNQFGGERNNISNTLNLLNIQNVYVEILFKYLINNYGYNEALKQFQNLIRILLTQNTFLQIGLIHEQHKQFVETIINKIEQDYKMDYEELMDLSH